MSHQISRSVGLSSVPERKVIEALEQTIHKCEVCSKKPDVKLNHNLCEICRLRNKCIQRYADANIPVVYWDLEMERNFTGDPVLKEKYLEITKDLRQSYRDGIAICLAGGHGRGKMISLDTELPTPKGFVTLSELKEGDQLFDENGNICKVIKLHPIDLTPESYEIEFDDGTKVEACADHLWLTWDSNARKASQRSKNPKILPQIRSTKDILRSLRTKHRGINHSIPCAKPINYKAKSLPIDPYVLGCWLGDGTSLEGTIECADAEILNEISKAGYSINKLSSSKKSKSSKYRIGDVVVVKNKKIGHLTYQLKSLGLIGNKHIPEIYLHGSYEQRLSLLQGLMDTDGCCSAIDGRMEFSSALPNLAKQVHQLMCSLGLKPHLSCNKSYLKGKICKDRYRIHLTTSLPIFRLPRKFNNIKSDRTKPGLTINRYIVDIKPIAPKPMRCITVDSPSHLFLITRAFIPTHNTMTCCNVLKRAVEKNFSSLYVNLGDIVSVMLNGKDSEDRATARRELLMVDFLVVDEFDPRYMSNDKASDLFGKILEEIFRSRTQNKLPIMMCTNSPDVVKSFSGAIKESIESLMSGVKTIPVLGKDQRIANASKGKK